MISENIKLHQNRNFYSKKWKLETIIWISIAVLLSMVFLIIIGAGPLSKKTIGSKEEGFIVELQTMLRYKRAFSLNFSVNPPYPGKDYRIRINKGFLKNMSTIKIMPEPEVTFIGKDDYIFSFNIPEPTKETRIVFYLEPVVTGITKLIVVQENGKVMETDAFIYP